MSEKRSERQKTDDLETTCDRFLGGRIEIVQPKSGAHRSGLDAVLLAASLPEGAKGDLIDLGAGVGVAGLAALALNPRLRPTLVDNDPDALRLAEHNARRTAELIAGAAMARVVAADVTRSGQQRRGMGLEPQSADFVITNPPYNEAGKARASPHPERAHAHMLDDASLQAWIRTGIWLLRPKGQFTIIIRTTRLPLALETFGKALGGITVLPIHARADQAAARVLVHGRLGSKAPLRLLPGLVLHGKAGSDFLPACAAIFAGQGRLSMH